VSSGPRMSEWKPLPASRYEMFPIVELEEDYRERLEFPADRHRIVLDLGGIPVEVRTDSHGVFEYLEETLGAFAVSSEPAVRLAIGQTDGLLPLRRQLGTLGMYAHGSHVFGRFRELAGYIDVETGDGRGVISGTNYRQDVFNFLRLVINAFAPSVDALLFHTAAVARDGRALLFYGPAMAGKSTLSRLAVQRYELMTDDMLMLRFSDGGLRAASCGFWGGETKEYASKPLDLPVAGFFRLRQGSENRLQPIRGAQRALDVVCQTPSMARRPHHHSAILDFASRAADAASFHELTFQKKDDSFWSVIDELDC